MKKVAGIIMIIVGVVLAIPTIFGVISLLSFSRNTSYEIGYTIGFLIWELILIVVIYLLIKYGIRFQKKTAEK